MLSAYSLKAKCTLGERKHVSAEPPGKIEFFIRMKKTAVVKIYEQIAVVG